MRALAYYVLLPYNSINRRCRSATERSMREVRSLREVAWLNTPSRLYLSDFTVRIESIESDHLQLHYTVMQRLSDELRTSQRSELMTL